jgi:myo-inositol-1(or 4)-monophosphatase
MNEKIKKVALGAVKKSAKAILPIFKKFDRHTVMLKAKKEAVTEADKLSEKIIINEIQKNFLKHDILSEEFGSIDNKSEYRWILDPIDGTTSFTEHSPLWCISLAVAHKDELIFSVVYAPDIDELFIAEKGKGATVNGRKINVSDFSDGKTLNAYCHDKSSADIQKAVKYFSYQKLHGTNIQQLGSAALELCYIAAGRIESLAVFGANAWDVSGGILMVKEAGGKVTDFNNRSWQIGGREILATNGKVHSDLLEIIKKL